MTILTIAVNERHDAYMRWLLNSKLQWAVWTAVIMIVTQMVNRIVLVGMPELVVLNQSAIFGLVDQPILIFLIVVVGLWLAWKMIHLHWHLQLVRWGISLIVAGALSNLLDRIVFDGVVDYLRFGSWSVFNLADIEIIAGVLVLLVAENNNKRTQQGTPLLLK